MILHTLIERGDVYKIFDHRDLSRLDRLIQQRQVILALQHFAILVDGSLQGYRLVIELEQFILYRRHRAFQLQIGVKVLCFRLFHIVAPGDSLWSIAKKYDVSLRTLYRNNYWLYGNPDIWPGQVLVIRYKEDERPSVFTTSYAYPFILARLLSATLPYMTAMAPFTYGLDKDGYTICPLCLKHISAKGFCARIQQAEGRNVPDLTVTEVSLFHIRELRTGEFNHKPYNLGWGHHHCNVVVKDAGIDATLEWMREVIARNDAQ